VKRAAFALRASVERDMLTASSTLISNPVFLDRCSRKENGRPLRMHSCSLEPRLGSPRLSHMPAVRGAPGRYSSTKGCVNSPKISLRARSGDCFRAPSLRAGASVSTLWTTIRTFLAAGLRAPRHSGP
jgi:hypothetical protein